MSDQNLADTQHSFTVKVGQKSKEYTDAQKAGEAYFKADAEKMPAVIHVENNRGRIMAGTETHGVSESGQIKYYKSLPDAYPIDKDFQAGFFKAMEKSVKARLQTLNNEANAATGEKAHPKMDEKLEDDLERLALYDREKTVKTWQKNAPDGLKVPFYLQDNVIRESVVVDGVKFSQWKKQQDTKTASGEKSSQSIPISQQEENTISFNERTKEPKIAQATTHTEELQPNSSEAIKLNNKAIPEAVSNRYLKIEDKYYLPDKSIAFEDQGNKLKLQTENQTVIRDAIAIAESRGWDSINITGSDNFKHQVWREASLKGIDVIGYKPTELEIAELTHFQSKLSGQSGKPFTEGNQEQSNNPESAWKKRRGDEPEELRGKLIEYGSDHYNHDPKNGKSYYVTLEVDGKEVTKWGSDLKRAVKNSKSEFDIGDTVVLLNQGKKDIEITTEKTNENGDVVEDKKTVQKNLWQIEKADYHDTLKEQAEALRVGNEIERQVIVQMPEVAAAVAAAKLGEKIAQQAKETGALKSQDEVDTVVYLIREGLAAALEKGKNIKPVEVREQGKQAAVDANNIINDHKPPELTKEPSPQEIVR